MARRSQLNWSLVLGYGLALALGVLAVIMVVSRRPAGQAVVLPEPPTPSPVRVHVTGAVAAPGVYPLPAGSIVLDAITAAGGPLAEADPNALNLARPVEDGDQIVVPLKPQPAATVEGQPAVTLATAPPPPDPSGPLNLNTATAAELETLPGIGPSLAQRIVAYRTEHGPFDSIEAIMDVPGIGPAKFEAIKELVTV